MRRRVRKFQGGGMDASQADFKTSGSGTYSRSYNPGAGGVVQHGGGKTKNVNTGGNGNKTVTTTKKKKNPFSVRDEPLDTPYKSNPVLNIVASALVPAGGLLMEGAQRRAYKRKQQFARKEGLYRDYYKTTGKPFQPNNPANRKYMKEAGYGKTKTIGGGGDDGGPQLCPDGTLPPCPTRTAAKPAQPIGKKKVDPMDLGFNFKRGGLSGGKRFGPPPKKGPDPHGKCPFRPDGIRGVGAVEPGRGVKFVGVK